MNGSCDPYPDFSPLYEPTSFSWWLFSLTMRELTKSDVIELAIGWQGAKPEQYSAEFELVTAKQTTLGQWKGWAHFPRSGDNWQFVTAINDH